MSGNVENKRNAQPKPASRDGEALRRRAGAEGLGEVCTLIRRSGVVSMVSARALAVASRLILAAAFAVGAFLTDAALSFLGFLGAIPCAGMGSGPAEYGAPAKESLSSNPRLLSWGGCGPPPTLPRSLRGPTGIAQR